MTLASLRLSMVCDNQGPSQKRTASTGRLRRLFNFSTDGAGPRDGGRYAVLKAGRYKRQRLHVPKVPQKRKTASSRAPTVVPGFSFGEKKAASAPGALGGGLPCAAIGSCRVGRRATHGLITLTERKRFPQGCYAAHGRSGHRAGFSFQESPVRTSRITDSTR